MKRFFILLTLVILGFTRIGFQNVNAEPNNNSSERLFVLEHIESMICD